MKKCIIIDEVRGYVVARLCYTIGVIFFGGIRMKRNFLFLIICIFAVSLFITGCESVPETKKDFDIPEVAKIQKVLDDLSVAVMDNNAERIAGSFSETCPRRQLELNALKRFMAAAKLDNYSQTVIGAERLRDGVVCTVSISCEGTSDSKSINSEVTRNIYFVFEDGAWRIGDYNYYPYMNPTVIVGNESALYDAASMISEALDSQLRTDTEHLQAYGDIILVGTPYDNASILELEEKGLTLVKVTDDYPGNSDGIVQVLSNVENYRHVLLIQGSSLKAAESSVRYMAEYMKDNPYINPGVYFIEEDGLRKAAPLEMSTLVTLDTEKTSRRLREVQKHMEANLSIMQEELQAEKVQLTREQGYISNAYSEDLPKVFSRYEFYPEQSLYDSMVMINANYTDNRLCTAAFELPSGNGGGTAYAYADFLNGSIRVVDNAKEDKGLLLGGGPLHTLTAHEINDSGNELEISVLGASMLRLAGFSTSEVYNIRASKGNTVFFNIGKGLAAVPGSPVVNTPTLQLDLGELLAAYNDVSFLSYENDYANLSTEETSEISDRARELFRQPGRLPGEAPEKVPFRESELEDKPDMPHNTEEIYGLLRNTFIIDDSPGIFSTLDEARDGLRSAMGSLLAAKCTRYIVNTASRYPASQFDYACYAAGLINVEYPNAYAEASLNSRLLKSLSGGISNLLSDDAEKTQKVIDILSDIADDERSSDMFFFPDYCIANKTASHWDKALLAFGLYGQLTGSTDNIYVALGESSSYLVFMEEDRWKYLDCRYNTIKDFVDDNIYAAFNRDFVYNERLGIGDVPEFAK